MPKETAKKIGELSGRIDSIEKEILSLDKKGMLLIKRALGLEDKLNTVLARKVVLERSKIAKARAEAKKRENKLLAKIAALKRKQMAFEKKNEVLRHMKAKSARIRGELKRVEDEIKRGTVELSRIKAAKTAAAKPPKPKKPVKKKPAVKKKAPARKPKERVLKKPAVKEFAAPEEKLFEATYACHEVSNG